MNELLYEDGLVNIFLLDRGMAEGHVTIYPKKEVRYLEQIPDNELNHIFSVANIVSSAVFEAASAQGTNIVINNGIKGLSINIIPRREGDKININWEPRPAKPEDLEKVQKKLKEHTDYIGVNFVTKKEERKDAVPEAPKDQEGHETIHDAVPEAPKEENEEKHIPKDHEDEEEEDYRVRQLFRMP